MVGFVVACVRSEDQIERHVSGRARCYLRNPIRIGFACAIVGVFAVAVGRFGDDATGTYAALSLAMPVLCLGALVVYAINLKLSRGYTLRARPRAASFGRSTGFTIRKWIAPLGEAARYADQAPRQLVVTSGLTGSGRSAGNHSCPGRCGLRRVLTAC